MEYRSTDLLLALLGGFVLTAMISFNSLLAKYSTPLYASWVAYGVGSAAALFLVVLCAKLFSTTQQKTQQPRKKIPNWVYLGGIPGAMTVVLAAVTVNSKLAFSGSFAVMLLGQVLFGLFSDLFGWFGTPKKKFVWMDLWVILLVLAGTSLIIFVR